MKYKKPEMEVLEFYEVSIITTSSGLDNSSEIEDPNDIITI